MNKFILSITALFFSFFNLTGCAYLRAKMAAFRLPPPTLQITSVSPTFSKTLGQTLITLRGTLFQKGLRVEIGKNNCESLKVLSDTELNCLVPASPKATVNISVINPDGKTAVLTDSFIYSDQLMSGGFSTQSYSEILSKVSPGNPAGSLLYQQVANNYMPRNGEPLTPAEKQKIFDWIFDGAKNN